MLEAVEIMRKEKVLQVHQYKITEPTDSKARWQTYIKDEKGARKKVSSTTEQGLYKKLYDYYFMRNAYTLCTLFPEWIEKRKLEGVSIRTIKRNENHWDKYYKTNKIATIPIRNLDADKIEKFFYETIKQYDLTVKELGNMKFIFVDMMKYAKRKGLIAVNPFLEVEIKTTGCRPPKKQNDTSRVYLPDEKEKMFIALNNEILTYPEVTDMYAIFLLFKLGLRVGECVALKWEDIDFNNKEVHIHRMQTLVEELGSDNLKCKVVNYTKRKSPYGDRFLPLGDYEISIFNTVKAINMKYGYKDGDFVFCDEKGRTTIREIDNRIRKMCNKAKIEVKSAHDIRRTVASEMFNNGIPVEIIRNYLGHSDIKTTYGYILDNQSKEETNQKILEALNKMSGLKRTQIA